MTIQKTNSTTACEILLMEDRKYNIEHNILRSENAVTDHLLDRQVELIEAYEEVWSKLHIHPNALMTFLGVVKTTAAFWNPKDIAIARDNRYELKLVNAKIAGIAKQLSALLNKRDELSNRSSFYSDTHYSVLKVVEDASTKNYLFQSYVKDELRAIRGRFDLKYWPALHEIVRVIGEDADEAETRATDPMTAASTSGTRSSLSDFFRALFVSIDENRTSNHGWLPDLFTPKDATLASFANCALNLGQDELVDGAYVKRFRQRERDRDLA
jgi:hypothetical protein